MKTRSIAYISTAVLFIASVIGAYFLGKSQTVIQDNATLLRELDSLRSHESDAAVVKRVSQQMESIAYQQKSISDKQRVKAEEQSKIAMEMRYKAEQESQAARDAENKAVLAADVARQQRELALSHQKSAEEQRDHATYAKNVADTLTYRSLGRTLGNTASIQFENGKTDLADYLALMSWEYLEKYEGNTYQPEVFKALSTCTGTRRDFKMPQLGAVMDLFSLGNSTFVGVSDYGEIEYCSPKEQKTKVLFQNRDYDFHAVSADKKNIYALSAHGPLVVVSYDGRSRIVSLPKDKYITLLEDDDDKPLIIVGEHRICRYDKVTGAVSPMSEFRKTLSSIVRTNKKYILFFTDGTCNEMSYGGTLKTRKPFVNGIITSAFYDKQDDCIFLGSKSGNMYIINHNEVVFCTLECHTSSVTTLCASNGVLVAGAYDKTISVWNLYSLSMDGYGDYKAALNSKGFNKNVKSNAEWLTPVSYSYSGWPLSSCISDNDHAVIGISSGIMQSINISTVSMASILKERKPETKVPQEEWMRYVVNTTK